MLIIELSTRAASDRKKDLSVNISDDRSVRTGVGELVLCHNEQMMISFREHGIKDVVDFMRKQAGMKIGVAFAEQFLTDQPLVINPSQFFAV